MTIELSADIAHDHPDVYLAAERLVDALLSSQVWVFRPRGAWERAKLLELVAAHMLRLKQDQ